MRFVPVAAARTADFVAQRDGVRWAVELRTSSRPLREDASFEPAADGAPLPYPTLESYLALLWREKRAQLEATMAAEGCPRGLLLVATEGVTGAACAGALARAYEEARRPAGVHFGVLCAGALGAFPRL